MQLTLLKTGQYLGSTVQSLRTPLALLTETRYAPDTVLPAHRHERLYLCLVTAGEYEEVSRGERQRYARGHVVYHPPADVHSNRFAPRGGRCFNIEIDPAWAVGLTGRADLERQRPGVVTGKTAVREVVALNRLAGDYLLNRDWTAYEAARTKGLHSAWSKIAEGYPASADSPAWDWLRMVGFFDPIPYWKRVRQPVLVINGAEDERDNVPVAESVRRLEMAFATVGHRDHRIVVVPGVGHSLLDHRTHEFPAELVAVLTGWLAKQGK